MLFPKNTPPAADVGRRSDCPLVAFLGDVDIGSGRITRDSDNAERLTGRARIRDTQFLPSTWLDLCQPDEHTSRARPTLWLARAHSASPPYLDGNHFFSFTSRFWGALL